MTRLLRVEMLKLSTTRTFLRPPRRRTRPTLGARRARERCISDDPSPCQNPTPR